MQPFIGFNYYPYLAKCLNSISAVPIVIWLLAESSVLASENIVPHRDSPDALALPYSENQLHHQLGKLIDKYGENHRRVAVLWNNLGVVYRERGDYSKAISYYNKAVNKALAVVGEQHKDIPIYWNNLGWAWGLSGDFEKSKEFHRRALVSNLRIYGPGHLFVADSYNNMGLAWTFLKRDDKALELFYKAMDVYKDNLQDNNEKFIVLLGMTGRSLRNLGETDKASRFYLRAIAALEDRKSQSGNTSSRALNRLKAEYNQLTR